MSLHKGFITMVNVDQLAYWQIIRVVQRGMQLKGQKYPDFSFLLVDKYNGFHAVFLVNYHSDKNLLHDLRI